MKERYVLYHDTCELPRRFVEHGGDIIAGYIEGDRDGGEIVATFETKEVAMKELAKRSCTCELRQSWATAVYSCEFFYVSRELYSEEWEEWEQDPDFDPDFAEIKAEDESYENH